MFVVTKKLLGKSLKTGKANQLSFNSQLSLPKILSLSEGIKKLPLLNFTSNKSFGLIPIIIPTSSRETRSGGLSIDMESDVFKYGKGTCNDTFSPTENFILNEYL